MTAARAAVEADPGRVAAEVARRFPGTSAWLGGSTGRWWALARDRTGADRLVEASTPGELVRRLDGLGVRPAVPMPAPRYTRVRPAAVPDATVPDLARVVQPTAAPVRPLRERHRRAPRRGWLRTVFGGLAAS
ncbi:hypothetical protein BJF79_20990 [Actinomadura sp. CNU-125]|uniref:hypothetical protein n=1 Tax=Actinomadura sp. CNU-125 TaxID=1904961 RepID=UPI000962BCFA|nr:hypothetical protein [Actinomadura sp. CNU-125]OLT13239.1 hypothetical protein BJF79_20990 [Actinomadura sp. CNU-125]